LLGFTLFAFAGGFVANYGGGLFCTVLFCALCAIWDVAGATWSLLPVAAPVVRGKALADGKVQFLESLILSRCFLFAGGIGRKFAWRREHFITFGIETFLLKRTSKECEFVHRLLRDYFALRVLRPRLSVPDKQRRLDAIRFLGYQGEASLDVLTEFATDEDPE